MRRNDFKTDNRRIVAFPIGGGYCSVIEEYSIRGSLHRMVEHDWPQGEYRYIDCI